MKILIPLSFIVALIFSGCENFKSQYEQANKERDSLIAVGEIKDSSLNDFMGSMNEIETNLDTIAHKQRNIEQAAAQPAENRGEQKVRINENIRIINDLLDQNNLLIGELQKKASAQGHRISELKKLVDNLNQRVSEKDTELVMLKFQLDDMKMNVENLNVTIDTLTAQNVSKESSLKENIGKLHTAYYIIGTFKELRDKKIINKEGGFLGMGKSQIMRRDFNTDSFTKIDVTQVTSFDLNCKEAKIITIHPSDSYTLDKDKDKVKSLTVSDYEKFWGVSKYLVIEKN
jgi:hypothetical protein